MASGLRSAKEKVHEAARDMRESFNEAFKHIGSLFSAGAIIAGIEKLVSHVHSLRVESENLGAGLEFLQGFQHASEQIGPGAEKGAKALEVMSRTLGAAKEGSAEAIAKFEKLGISVADIASMNTDQMFFRVADAIKDTGDASVRTERAFTVMGKAGVAMTGMLAQGSEALKEHMNSAAKLSEEDAKNIELFHSTIKNVLNDLEIGLGKLVSMWGRAWTDMGKLASGQSSKMLAETNAWIASKEMDKRIAREVEQSAKAEEVITQAKLRENKKRNDEMEKQSGEVRKADREIELYTSGAEPGSAEFIKAKIESEKEVIKALEEQRGITQDETERNAQLVDLRKVQVDLARDEAGLKKKEREDQDKAAKKQEETAKKQERADEKRKKTVEEIAKTEDDIALAKLKQQEERTGKYRPSLDELAKSRGPFQGIAQQIQKNEAQAKQRFIAGNIEGANALINQNEGYDQTVGYNPTQEQEQSAMTDFAAASKEHPATSTADVWKRKQDYWNLQHGIGFTKKEHVPGLLDKLRGQNGPLSPDMAAIESEKHLKALTKIVDGKTKLLVKPELDD